MSETTMAGKKPTGRPRGVEAVNLVHFNARITPEQLRKIEEVAAGLGLKPSALMRLILSECLPKYVRRVRNIRGGGEEAGAE